MDQLYDVKRAAKERLGNVSPWSVYKWISQRKLEKTKVGRRTMVAESAIQRFLKACNRAE